MLASAFSVTITSHRTTRATSGEWLPDDNIGWTSVVPRSHESSRRRFNDGC